MLGIVSGVTCLWQHNLITSVICFQGQQHNFAKQHLVNYFLYSFSSLSQGRTPVPSGQKQLLINTLNM